VVEFWLQEFSFHKLILFWGHKFDQRVGHTNQNHKDSERSPIFTQFIDAVWQIRNNYPSAFEFNDYFLRIINMHLVASSMPPLNTNRYHVYLELFCSIQSRRDGKTIFKTRPYLCGLTSTTIWRQAKLGSQLIWIGLQKWRLQCCARCLVWKYELQPAVVARILSPLVQLPQRHVNQYLVRLLYY
jgi:hypothetical protein